MSTQAPPRILLMTASPALDGLGAVLAARGLGTDRARTDDEAARLLAQDRARWVAVLDTSRPASYSFATVYRLLHAAPPVPTLVLLAEGTSQPPAPADSDTDRDEFARLPASLDELTLRIEALLVRLGVALPGPPVAASGARRVERPPERNGHVVVVFGAKGGVGRSVIAVNLAVGLAQLYGHDVGLIDADLWFGDLAVLLNIRSKKNLASMAESGGPIDVDMLHEVLVPHPSGIHVVIAPEPEQVECVPVCLPTEVLGICRGLFDFTVVDTQPSLDEHTLQVLETADMILLVTTPEVSAIRNTTQFLHLAPRLNLTDRLCLVLNRANSGVALEQVEQNLQMPVAATIVSAGARVVDAANHGQPVFEMDPTGREQVTRDLGALVARVAGRPPPRWKAGVPLPPVRRLLPWSFRPGRAGQPGAKPTGPAGAPG